MRPQITLRRAITDALPSGSRLGPAGERVLAAVRALAPEITARAAEIEAARRLPPDLVETLRAAGVFRMMVPRSHGGLELDLPSALDVVAALARMDGAVGWCAMIGGTAPLFAALLPPDTYELIYRDGPDVILAGSSRPAGTAEPVPAGWRVTGRWPFASGCQHADWIMALCLVTRNGRPMSAPDASDGTPQMQAVVMPARDWRIDDTWHVAGLVGTGSHHVALDDVMVPAANTFDLTHSVPCVASPLSRAVPYILPVVHAAASVGMAEGALDELVAVAGTGLRRLNAPAPLQESESFQIELGRLAADVRAARAVLEAEARTLWRHAQAGTLKDEVRAAQAGQAGAWISALCTRVGTACFQLAGASALYHSSPLQRRMRDLQAATLHATVHPRQFGVAGKLLLQ